MKKKYEQASLLNEDEEENYFVSLSDLMTGVLFVFVILTTALALHYHTKSVESDKQSRELEKAKQGVIEARGKAEEVQEALDALAKVLREREQLRKQELEALVTRLEARGFSVDLDESNGTLRLPERLLFTAGEAKIQPNGERALEILAKEMLPTVMIGGGTGPLKWEAVYVEGHTDDIPISTNEFASNWELSSARAINTFKALLKARPSLEYLTNPLGKRIFGISGYGEKRPVGDNSKEAGRQKNRRIDIRFVMAYPSQSEIDDMERKLKEASKKMESVKP
jgi:chemotaxis protein MotB